MQNPKNNNKDGNNLDHINNFGNSEEKLSDIDEDESKCKKRPWTI